MSLAIQMQDGAMFWYSRNLEYGGVLPYPLRDAFGLRQECNSAATETENAGNLEWKKRRNKVHEEE